MTYQTFLATPSLCQQCTREQNLSERSDITQTAPCQEQTAQWILTGSAPCKGQLKSYMSMQLQLVLHGSKLPR